jgi:hypothetical protein
MKDIFIDNNIANNFCNPVKESYKGIIAWLSEEGSLVVSDFLVKEYHASIRGNISSTNILAIISTQIREGRLVKIGKKEIENFTIKPKVKKGLLCNRKDVPHLKAVLLSNRKYALTLDKNLKRDLIAFPGFSCKVGEDPDEIPYN